MANILKLAAEWLDIDEDPVTHAEMEQLISANNISELTLRLHGRIAFGTAGLRARMEAGFTRMNCVTVIQASQGLAAYILTQDPNARTKGIVIGHDARFNSEKFAKLAAAAFLGKGIRVWLFGSHVHTPLVPFAVTEQGAAAGVMVTASHNPAKDNGYKVYWSNGCQIIPPHDKGIAAAINENLEPLSWDHTLSSWDSDMVKDIQERTEAAYYERVASLVNLKPGTELAQFIYTPMHGVGLAFLTNTLRRVTCPDVDYSHATGSVKSTSNTTTASSTLTQSCSTPSHSHPQPFITVPLQALPDPNFPTLPFPNPEERGALNIAITTATDHDLSLILATDPDADRLAVAELILNPSPDKPSTWHQYTGNEVGILLASYILSTYSQAERKNLAMLASTVSSSMLRYMAEKEGFHFAETLTGFKWLGNTAQRLAREKGWTIPFAYEEALGYMFTAVGHDKDGIAAAAVFLAAAAQWREQEQLTPWQKLQQLYATYGYFAEANTYLVSPSPEVTASVFAKIRAVDEGSGKSYPTQLGDRRIMCWRDLTTGYDSATVDNIPELPVDAGSQMITVELDSGVRFTVRGSGTEPKIKLYIEARADSMEDAKARAEDVQGLLVRDWFSPTLWGLRLAGH